MERRQDFLIVITSLIMIIGAACTNDREEAVARTEPPPLTRCQSSTIPVDNALEELDAVLDVIYPSTRGVARKTYSRENISVCGGIATRSDDAVNLPDTIVYVVNFDNEEGFAVLGAQVGMQPIYAITDDGSLDAYELDPLIMSEYDALQDIYIDFDAIDEAQEDVCDCGYQGDDDDHDCLDNDDFDDSFIDDEDIHKRLLCNSIATDMLIVDRGQDQRDYINLDPTEREPYDKPVDRRTDTVYWKLGKHVEPMLAATEWWNQGDPFNKRCNGCRVGCVVIAVAQIMAYHEATKDGTLLLDGKTCYWEIIKSRSMEEDAVLQRACLCRELGKSPNCNVSYGTDSSGALATGAKRTLKNYGFQNVKKRTNFDKKNRARAVEMILAGKPVYLGARGDGSGHAFVLDGYIERYQEKIDTTFYTDGTYNVSTWHRPKQYLFHVNWGWGGSHNGYFMLSDEFSIQNRYGDWHSDSPSPSQGEDKKYTWHFRMITYDI